MKQSTCEWNTNYPKDKDLGWKIKPVGEKSYVYSDTIPFDYDGSNTKFNSQNVDKVSVKYGVGNLEAFL